LTLLVTIHRLAYRLKLPAPWLRAQAEAGKIPCLKVGRRVLFNPAAVERALAEMAANSTLADGPQEAAHA
jgi:excisionase family DNA binding protein